MLWDERLGPFARRDRRRWNGTGFPRRSSRGRRTVLELKLVEFLANLFPFELDLCLLGSDRVEICGSKGGLAFEEGF